MLKVNELRVGNIIQTKAITSPISVPFTVTGKFIMQAEALQGDIGNYEGLPITEEWLLKLGFDLESDANPHFSIQTGNNIAITYDLVNKECGLGLHWRGQGSTIWNQIRHIHQLQNLYFAITGNELSIN